MVDFSLTDEQREVQRTARAFGEREILPRIRELDSTSTYDRGLYEKMGAVGFLGLPIPERYGGSGMDYIAFAALCEEMERADTAFRVILSVHTGLNSLTQPGDQAGAQGTQFHSRLPLGAPEGRQGRRRDARAMLRGSRRDRQFPTGKIGIQTGQRQVAGRLESGTNGRLLPDR